MDKNMDKNMEHNIEYFLRHQKLYRIKHARYERDHTDLGHIHTWKPSLLEA